MAAEKETVVLLHGLWCRGIVMSCLARRLRMAGYTTVCPSYRTWRTTPDKIARKLQQSLVANGTLEAGSDSPLHFVAHSLGGLVLMSLFNQAAGEDRRLTELSRRLGQIVLIASPVNGSSLAAKLVGSATSKVLTGNDLAIVLSSPTDQSCFPAEKSGAIAGTAGRGLLGWLVFWLYGYSDVGDGLVSVRETQLNSPHACHLPYSHGRLLYSRAVADQVVRFVSTGSFRAEKKLQRG